MELVMMHEDSGRIVLWAVGMAGGGIFMPSPDLWTPASFLDAEVSAAATRYIVPFQAMLDADWVPVGEL